MACVKVRRLAAMDMYGSRGSVGRRRFILAEFCAAAVFMVGFGIFVLTRSADFGGRAFGLWLIGAGLNYAPLAAYAIVLSRPGALDADLAGVDVGPELRRSGVYQLWIFVPLLLVILAGHDALTRTRSARAR